MGGIEYEQGGGPPMREIDEGSHPDDENVVYENFAAEPEPVHPNQAWKFDLKEATTTPYAW